LWVGDRRWVTSPNVQLHYTPTYVSWLNQVELWFAKVKPDFLTRGIFMSVTDLAHGLQSQRNRPRGQAVSDSARAHCRRVAHVDLACSRLT